MTKMSATNSNAMILWINIALTLVNIGTVVYSRSSFANCPSDFVSAGTDDTQMKGMFKRRVVAEPRNLSSNLLPSNIFLRPLVNEAEEGQVTEPSTNATLSTTNQTRSPSSSFPVQPVTSVNHVPTAGIRGGADSGNDAGLLPASKVSFVDGFDGSRAGVVSSAFVRYGRKTCPGDSSSLHNSYGYAAAIKVSGFLTSSTLICLPKEPEMSNTPPRLSTTSSFSISRRVQPVIFRNEPHSNSNRNDVGILQCVTCLSDHQIVMMFPGKDQCHFGWKQMYKGWLVSSHLAFNSLDSAPLYCVDDSFSVYDAASYLTRDHVILTHVHSGECIHTPEGICESYSNNHLIPCIVCARS